MVSTWPHLEHNDSDPYLGLFWTCRLRSLTGYHWDLDLSYIPGPHLDLVIWTHLGITWRGDWFPQGPHLDLVTQVLVWASWDLVSQFHIGASPGPSDSRNPLGLTLTW